MSTTGSARPSVIGCGSSACALPTTSITIAAARPKATIRSPSSGAVMGREADDPLPDFAVFPPVIGEFESPPGTYYDAWPLLVITTSALASLEAALPDSVVDIHRFRPSIVIDTDDGMAGHPEFGWKGRTATVGSAVIDFLDPCPRCVMVTRQIDAAIPADRAILRHIIDELEQNVGVYATIRTPGTVRVGDPVVFA